MMALIVPVRNAALIAVLLFPIAISECELWDPYNMGESAPQNVKPAWDTDGDGISNAVELNDANDFHNFDTALVDTDPSIARGLPNNGWIDCAINLVDYGTGYYHYRALGEAVDSDDWGVLAMLNVVEGVGREWYMTDEVLPRVGVGDISKGDAETQQFGGPWDHDSHQNGTDLDARYVRCDKEELPLNIEYYPEDYDKNLTINLIADFIRSGRVLLFYVDTVHIGFKCSYFIHDATHNNHFHLRIVDPDGLDNKVRMLKGRERQ